jgi:ATP-dependent Clp protease adaptor protein ClpS
MTGPADPRIETIERTDDVTVLAGLFHLVLLDDDAHSYQYVVDLLGHVFGYGREKSFAMACMVDSTGRATVETAGHPQVVGHQRQIHAYGADPQIGHSKGSMSAIIERAS